jgi:cysteine-S-conjugate beta-lyase
MPPSDVTAFSIDELRMHRSEKWREFPSDVLPLPVAEMDFPIAPPIRELLMEMVSHSDLGYLGPIPEVALSFEAFAKRRWGWVLDPNQVHIVTDVGVGVVEVLRLFTGPGDRVLINTPVYHNFSTWIGETKLEKVDVPFVQDGREWKLDLAGIEKAYQSGVKAHLLCSPHNPIGYVYSKAELLKIAQLAVEYSVIVISDEIHGPLTFSESTFVPFLSLGEEAESVGIVVTAASKAWNIAGLKCAIVVSQSPAMDALLKKLPIATHYRASLLGGFATAAAFSQGEPWLESVLKTLDFNRFFLRDLLDKKIPEIKYQVPSCTYLAWLDLEALNLGRNPSQILLDRGRVALSPGIAFSPNTSHFVRLNFATSPEILTEAVDRMAVAIS